MKKQNWFVQFVTGESPLLLAAVTVFALFLRMQFFPYVSTDYTLFLQGWFSELKAGGGFAAIGRNIGDYMPPYFYLLAFLTYLPGRPLFLIKGLSFLGDVVLAFFAMRIVERQRGKFWGCIVYATVLFLPSVILNSGAWAQCDAIYTAALLACVYFVMKKRDYAAVAAFSVAFVFKLQTVFLAPFLLLMLLKKRIRWRCVLVFPAVYLAAILPSALMGRSFTDLLTVYFRQAGEYSSISMNLPNLAVWYPADTPVPTGHLLALAAVLAALVLVFVLWRLDFELTDEMILSLAFLSVLFVPYFLPYMHERYLYPADIFSVLFAFYLPEKFYIPIITVFSSTAVVGEFLFGTHLVSVKLLSVLMFFCLLWVMLTVFFAAKGKRFRLQRLHR